MKNQILSTLVYADIFNYPLKRDELWKWLIANSTVKKLNGQEKFDETLKMLLKEEKIQRKSNYFFLTGRFNLIEIRKDRIRASKKKLKKAKRIATILRMIPTIHMVAVTGALAMNNSSCDDDIDFLIISKKRWLWTTRFLTVMLLSIVGKRRTPGSKRIKDKICLNLFLTEDDLEIKPHDLYLAHEVLQTKPLWQRKKIYEKFINANSWTFSFLPNASSQSIKKRERPASASVLRNLHPSSALIERLARSFQLWYMKKRRTREKISDTQLFFHPKDTRGWILKEFRENLRQFDLKSKLPS